MNNLNDQKSSQKVFLFALLGILLVGIPLTITMLQKQQIFKQFAWSTTQSASASCSSTDGSAAIQVTFTNTETSKSMDVVAKDMQTGKSITLGTVKPQKTATNSIITNQASLNDGTIMFTLSWTDGTSGTDTRTASYKAVSGCSASGGSFCPNNPSINEGKCSWDPVDGTANYEVKITNATTGNLVKTATVSNTTTDMTFVMEPGTAYTCSVTPVNACSKTVATTSDQKTCTPPNPTSGPTPAPTNPPYCPMPPQKLGECSWDLSDGVEKYSVIVKDENTGKTVKSETVNAPTQKLSFTADPEKTYVCTVTAINACGKSRDATSQPISCVQPTQGPSNGPTEKPTPVPSDRPTTVPSITSLPTATNTPLPTNTPTPSPTPLPTATPTPLPTATPRPLPTATPYIILKNPANVAPQVIVQQPRTIVQQPQTVVQQPQTVVQQPQTVVQQPQTVVQQPQTVVQQPQPTIIANTTVAPTVKPTGNGSNAIILVGASSILLLIGSMLFFLL